MKHVEWMLFTNEVDAISMLEPRHLGGLTGHISETFSFPFSPFPLQPVQFHKFLDSEDRIQVRDILLECSILSKNEDILVPKSVYVVAE